MEAGGVDSRDPGTRRVMLAWLALSVLSLVFAGVFAVVVALARTPVVEGVMTAAGAGYLRSALVGHVVSSVVVWLLAFEAFLLVYVLSSDGRGRGVASPRLGLVSAGVALAGMAVVAHQAITGAGEPVLADYVPIVSTPLFLAGLSAFATGVVVNILNASATAFSARGVTPRGYGALVSSAAVLSALVCVTLAVRAQGPGVVDPDLSVWGGGHMLQFANTSAMVVAWMTLAGVRPGGDPPEPRAAYPLFSVYLAGAVAGPLVYLFFQPSHPTGLSAFTLLMAWGLGPVTMVFIALTARGLSVRGSGRDGAPLRDPASSALVLSMVVFVAGAVMGAATGGADTRVPAHYHSSIGAVTIAFMGLFYKVMPGVGKRVAAPRLARVQPWLYSAGVLVFSLGLFAAGGHGVERKAFAGEQALAGPWEYAAMGVMALGALLAVAGGITFVAVASVSLLGRRG